MSASAGGEVILVAALDRNRAIGTGNRLPWRLPDDFRRFKERTTGGVLVMGRRTAESLGRALPNRRNLVLTRSGAVPFDGMEPVASLAEAARLAGGASLLVIGGGEVYALALPYATQLWLTQVDTEVEDADAWFPQIDPNDWKEHSREGHPADAHHAVRFDYVDYKRRGAAGQLQRV